VLQYAKANEIAASIETGDDLVRVLPIFIDATSRDWLDDYFRHAPDSSDVVEVQSQGFSYLFDIAAQRLIAAWGLSRGRVSVPRDKNRMAGHPRGAGPTYHRGHAIPHLLGGGTDINLVPQLARINTGKFRILERKAAANPGSLYFTYWQYADSDTQLAIACDQGLLVAGDCLIVERHGN
jgi:hypothetical protein